ncbi:hypothetical protein Tco_0902948 [Tanacetum coccineum]
MLHASGSNDGVGSQPKVPDELQDKTTGINEGTGTIPGVPDVPKDQPESENESWGESGDDDDSNYSDNDNDSDDDSNNVESDDDHEQVDDERTESNDEEEETQDDEFVHTPDDYVPTDDETNDESKDVDEEEYERINEELYGDVNVSLTDAKPDDKEKGAGNQLKDDAQATQKTEVVSMLDINVQHEVKSTLPFLTIPVSIIPENTIDNPPEIVTTTSSTTISSLPTSLFPHLQELTPIPTLTTTEATSSTTVVPDSETLSSFHKRITNLEKDVKELKTIDHSATLLSTIKSEVPNAVKEYLE